MDGYVFVTHPVDRAEIDALQASGRIRAAVHFAAGPHSAMLALDAGSPADLAALIAELCPDFDCLTGVAVPGGTKPCGIIPLPDWAFFALVDVAPRDVASYVAHVQAAEVPAFAVVHGLPGTVLIEVVGDDERAVEQQLRTALTHPSVRGAHVGVSGAGLVAHGPS